MDKKITELIQTNEVSPDSFLAIANELEDRNYKLNISDLVKHVSEFINDNNPSDIPSAFDAEVEDVAVSDKASASVNYKDGLFSFRFGLQKGPKGDKGEPGEKGEPGVGKDGVGTRTVFVFKSSETKPKKPTGGSWDPKTNTITYPTGWSPTDNLVHPVWMSNASFSEEGIVLDWIDPILITGEDGVNGTDGVSSEFVFKLFAEEQFNLQPPYSDPKVDDYQVDGWIDHPTGVSKTMPYEYMCIRYKNSDTGLWGEFSKPALWSKYGVDGRDGDGVEYIYQLTLTEVSPSTPGKTPAAHSPTKNYQDREFIPAAASGERQWTDNPAGVSETYPCEWVSVRKYNQDDQLWGDFSQPTLWAKYGKDGKNGEAGTSVTILGSYNSYEELREAWENGTLTGNNPPKIGDGYLINGDLWVFDGDDFYNCGQIRGPLGEPGQSMYVHIKYADYLDRYGYGVFTDNEGETPGKYIGIRVDYVEMDSTTPSDYVWSKFNGNDGFGYEYIFQRSIEFVAPTIPTTITASNVAPDGWTDDPTGVDSEYKYEWSCYRKSDENGNWGAWRGKKEDSTKAWLFAMYAESVPGATGSNGPVLYPAGEWESGEYTQTWNETKNIPTATPYVIYNNMHYVLMVRSTTERPGSGTDWQYMENFSALYTDILLADRATVGNACFYGLYMFSQQGEGNLSDFDITTNNPYASNSGFKPAWCVNLVTGELWAGTGRSYFAADGSGYVANRNIEWDANGVLLNYPKTGMASIAAVGNAARTIINVEINVDANYDEITSSRVYIYNMDGDILASSDELNLSPGSSAKTTIQKSDNSAFETNAIARLYLNDKFAASDSVAFESPDITDPGQNYAVLIQTVDASISRVYLHNSSTRTVGQYDSYFALPMAASAPYNAQVVWNTVAGLVVNTNTPNNSARAFAGDTVYVYTSSSATSSATSFTLSEANQRIDV